MRRGDAREWMKQGWSNTGRVEEEKEGVGLIFTLHKVPSNFSVAVALLCIAALGNGARCGLLLQMERSLSVCVYTLDTY